MAVVFGRESSGLSNRELDVCDGIVSIPVAEEFPSINLAAAVALIAYEVRKTWTADEPRYRSSATSAPATVTEREHLFDHEFRPAVRVDRPLKIRK